MNTWQETFQTLAGGIWLTGQVPDMLLPFQSLSGCLCLFDTSKMMHWLNKFIRFQSLPGEISPFDLGIPSVAWDNGLFQALAGD